ncbi:MAG: hypothetical protein F4196_02825, partial [Acidimicrobiia bacterium]|nr:hypothetical protein [Acidimicrobiia bacterium]
MGQNPGFGGRGSSESWSPGGSAGLPEPGSAGLVSAERGDRSFARDPTGGRLMSSLLPKKPDPLAAVFDQPKPIIGVIHLPPLPGAPRYDGQPVEVIYAAGVADAVAMSDAGIDGIIVENAVALP